MMKFLAPSSTVKLQSFPIKKISYILINVFGINGTLFLTLTN